MKEKFFYKDNTNILVPMEVFGILIYDAHHFGYTKNGTANLCGFLNRLIPELSTYRDDLHNQFLKFNNGNENITAAVESSIYQVYLNTFSLNDDGKINIPFRISKKYQHDFLLIQSEKLQKYQLDFTNYVRSLLEEYVIKPPFQRELFFHYRNVQTLKSIIRNENVCILFSKSNSIEIIPAAIEPLIFLGKNYIVGLDVNKENFLFFPLSDLEEIIVLAKTISLNEAECELIHQGVKNLLKEEEEN